jgi:AcrR family transcriptional regulator
MDFSDIRVVEIVKRSGYSRGAFYARFRDKYDLASRVLEREMLIYLKNTIDYVRLKEEEGDQSQLVSLMIEYFEHIYENRDLYDAILDSRLPGYTLDEFCSELQSMMRDRISSTLSTEASDCDLEFYSYVTIYDGIIYIKYWRLHGYQFSPEHMARQVVAFTENQAYSSYSVKFEVPQ